MKKFQRLTIVLLCLAIFATVLVGCTEPVVQPVDDVYSADGKVMYSFTGDEQPRDGYAEGYVMIYPETSDEANATYTLYWGDELGILENYYDVGQGLCSGDELKIEIGENIMVPVGANRLYVYKNGVEWNYVDLPKEKIYVENPSTVFASVSDIHMNYPEGADFWKNALNTYETLGVEYIIISGDITSDGSQFPLYKSTTESSDFSGLIFTCIGNHEQQGAGRASMFQYAIYDGANKRWVTLSEAEDYFYFEYNGHLDVYANWTDIEGGNSTYYYYITIGDNLYVFMDQMLTSTGNSQLQDNFSSKQLDWVENLLNKYSGKHKKGKEFSYEQYNLNIVQHSLIKNYSAGDKFNGIYPQPIEISDAHPNVGRFVSLLEEYTESIWMSGHTHIGFTVAVDYLDNVYDDQGNFTDVPTARSIHNSSVAEVRWYNGNEFKRNENYNSASEGYVCYQYRNDIVYEAHCFKEYNSGSTVSNYTNYITNKVYAKATFILPKMVASHSEKHIHIAGEQVTVPATATKAGSVTTYCAMCGEIMHQETLDTPAKPAALSSLSGEGTKSNPLKISSLADYKKFVTYVKSGATCDSNMQTSKQGNQAGYGLYFKQTADIAVTEVADVFTVTSLENFSVFAGEYDGNGYKLTANIELTDTSCLRFAVLPVVSGRVLNLMIEGDLHTVSVTDNNALCTTLLGIAKGGMLENIVDTITLRTYTSDVAPAFLCPVCGDGAIVRNVWCGGKMMTRSDKDLGTGGANMTAYIIVTAGNGTTFGNVLFKFLNEAGVSQTDLPTGIAFQNSRQTAAEMMETYRTSNSFASDYVAVSYNSTSGIVLGHN